MPNRELTELEKAYHRLFRSPDGKTVLESLMAACGVLSSNIPDDPLKMADREGKRTIGLYILGMAGFITINDLEVLCQK